MSASAEHEQLREALGAYALGALPEPEADRVHRHLEACPDCQAEFERLRAAVDALPASVTQIDAPPELKARVMATVEAEAALLQEAGGAADHPAPAPKRWFQRPRLVAATGLLAVCALVVVVVLVVSGAGTRTIAVRVTDTALAGRVRATLQVQGTQAELQVSGLPVPAPGHVEELWVQRESASPRPAGIFVLTAGSVRLSEPVRTGDRVLVTTEPDRGSPLPTTAPLLVARV